MMQHRLCSQELMKDRSLLLMYTGAVPVPVLLRDASTNASPFMVAGTGTVPQRNWDRIRAHESCIITASCSQVPVPGAELMKDASLSWLIAYIYLGVTCEQLTLLWPWPVAAT
jgi:hypothetical protein